MRPDLFAFDIMNFEFVSWNVGVWLAYGLPWVEMVAALGLLVPKTRLPALGVVIFLLTSFSILLAWTMARGMEVSCGCLGAGDGDLSSALWRNGIMITIAGALAWSEYHASDDQDNSQ